MILNDDDMLALIQMAQANLTRIADRFILEKEQENAEHDAAIAEVFKPKPTVKNNDMMTPKQFENMRNKTG